MLGKLGKCFIFDNPFFAVVIRPHKEGLQINMKPPHEFTSKPYAGRIPPVGINIVGGGISFNTSPQHNIFGGVQIVQQPQMRGIRLPVQPGPIFIIRIIGYSKRGPSRELACKIIIARNNGPTRTTAAKIPRPTTHHPFSIHTAGRYWRPSTNRHNRVYRKCSYIP